MTWHVFAAAVVGKSHEERNLPCQDAFAYRVTNDVLCAALCDGAGSAQASHAGARSLAVQLVEQLTLRVARGTASPQMLEADARKLLEELIVAARQELAAHAAESGTSLADYASTLVGALIGGEGGWLFHVGDGVAVAESRTPEARALVSHPENGEYANETYFVTGEAWQQHLRLSHVDEPLQTVVLMSDGAASFAMNRGSTALHRPFWDPVRYFLSNASEELGSRALAATLRDPRIDTITGDDRTLLVAQWRTTPEARPADRAEPAPVAR